METRIVEANVIAIIGEYGIAKVKEETLSYSGKVLSHQTFYDVCLEQGEGDIVVSFKKINEAKKWAKEN